MASRRRDTLKPILGFFRLLYGLIGFLGMLVLLVGIALPFSSEVRDDFCRIPINFVLDEPSSTFLTGGTEHSAVLTRTSGWLLIKDGPLALAYVNLFGFMVIAGVILFSLRKAINIVERVRKGEVFLVENMLELRAIARISIFLFFFLLVLQVAASLWASERLLSGPITLTGVLGPSLDFDLGSLVLPLLLWALAEVFRSGIEMKVDQELTI